MVWGHQSPPTMAGLGWAYYEDSEYTVRFRRPISGGSRQKITNNGLAENTRRNNLPVGMPDLWQVDHYVMSNDIINSVLMISISFQAMFVLGSTAWIDVEFENNDQVVWGNTLMLPQGINRQHKFSFMSMFFVDQPSSGLSVYLAPSNNTEFFNFSTLVNLV